MPSCVPMLKKCNFKTKNASSYLSDVSTLQRMVQDSDPQVAQRKEQGLLRKIIQQVGRATLSKINNKEMNLRQSPRSCYFCMYIATK